ncbi:hypothetical protein A1359_20140 [Methylomonas lenta]|uniref:Uncharacterized protein n=1 Tax=Methylomonas lenta TaxID=980561 RepID=A0A177NUI6_9GAMM|nr:hypothetical protein A1359_20140 [Methylomonas lenta]
MVMKQRLCGGSSLSLPIQFVVTRRSVQKPLRWPVKHSIYFHKLLISFYCKSFTALNWIHVIGNSVAQQVESLLDVAKQQQTASGKLQISRHETAQIFQAFVYLYLKFPSFFVSDI